MKNSKLCMVLMEKMLTEETLNHLTDIKIQVLLELVMLHLYEANDIYGILVDAIHYQIEKYIDKNDKHEELWSIVKCSLGS